MRYWILLSWNSPLGMQKISSLDDLKIFEWTALILYAIIILPLESTTNMNGIEIYTNVMIVSYLTMVYLMFQKY